jgi:hypothetical protein
LIVLRRKVQGRVWLTNNDRWFLIQLYRWFPSILGRHRTVETALELLKPLDHQGR